VLRRTTHALRQAKRGGAPLSDQTIAIIGAGAGGLCMGAKLKQAGIDSFTIYEKSEGVGGTWHDNTYPGACCDVPSHFYSFSFALNSEWSQPFSRQPEILAYFENLAAEHELVPHIRFNTEITALSFDEAANVWQLTTKDGETAQVDMVVSCLGQLNRPSVPDFPGMETFKGTTFHSARWNHEHDISGERVAVVGNAASALQFIPEIAPNLAHLDVHQRSANWVFPRKNEPYSNRRKWIYRNIPGVMKVQRALVYFLGEAVYFALRQGSRLGNRMQKTGKKHLAAQVKSETMRAELTPDYPIGCKRILASPNYYRTLTQENVSLVTSPIERFTETGILTKDGRCEPADTIIFATGFDSTHFLAPIEVTGRAGRRIEDAWKDGAEAYLGMTVPGFPNLFMLYGPNTNLGSNSILFMIECQVAYILRCLEELKSRGTSWLDVRSDSMEEYNNWVQESMGEMVWASDCQSWYKNESGKVTNNWPRTTLRYWRKTARPEFAHYEFSEASSARNTANVSL